MTITLHWWALPAILTALWALLFIWPARRNAWDDLDRLVLGFVTLVPVLLAWIVGLIFRGITQ